MMDLVQAPPTDEPLVGGAGALHDDVGSLLLGYLGGALVRLVGQWRQRGAGWIIVGRISKNIAFASIAVLSLAGHASAQERDEFPWKRGALSLGGFITKTSSALRIDSRTLGRGTEIDLLNELGIDDSVNKFRADAHWRFFPRHRLDLSYYNLSGDGSRSLSATIQVGDQAFVVGTTVASNFNWTIYKVGYSYSFVQNRRFELAAGLGIFGLDTGLRISATDIGTLESGSFFAPLPVLGLRGAFAVTPKFFLRTKIQYFGLDVGRVKGQLADATVSVDYDIFDRVAIGAGYNFVAVRLEADRSKFSGSLDVDYGGVVVFLKFNF